MTTAVKPQEEEGEWRLVCCELPDAVSASHRAAASHPRSESKRRNNRRTKIRVNTGEVEG